MRVLFRHAAILATLIVLAAPAAARADGDPASDVLLVQDYYTPYQPAPSGNFSRALTTVLTRARRAGFHLQVAIIATQEDLGAVPQLFGQPQRYAKFLASEIAFNSHKPLLVVMPAGYGTANVPAAVAAATGRLAAPASGPGSDGLMRAAIKATVALSAASGHAIEAPPIGPSPHASSGPSPALLFGAPIALIAIGAALATLRRKAGDPAQAGIDPTA